MILTTLAEQIRKALHLDANQIKIHLDELTVTVHKECLHDALKTLYKQFEFTQLIDLCAVDYLYFGLGEWETDSATSDGFSRGRSPLVSDIEEEEKPERFYIVYHLLSINKNCRVRVKSCLDTQQPMVETVSDIWPVANWFEREAFDLYGVLFSGHPDLRRILTDYGFVGHPMRKDFPISGHVEVRYCPDKKRVIYQEVSIPPRILVPKVVRHTAVEGKENE